MRGPRLRKLGGAPDATARKSNGDRKETGIMKVPLDKIAIDEAHRIRRDQGNLAALKASISRLGLLNPIVIDEEYRLVAGYRRLLACRALG